MATDTRSALLQQGALLFAARGGPGNVTARELHEAVGARNESALHYHFGGKEGLVDEVLRLHLETVEARRAPLVAEIEAAGQTSDLRALVRALAEPMAASLADPLGRAHLRLVAQLSHPALAYERPFRVVRSPAGVSVARWIWDALRGRMPEAIAAERVALLRSQLISTFGLRAQLVDEQPDRYDARANARFLANLVDMLVGGLEAEPSPEALRPRP